MGRILCIGAGRVGIPLALRFWDVGHDVSLIDIDTARVGALGEGRMPFHEPGCDELLGRAARSRRLRVMTYEPAEFPAAACAADYVVMTLGTPLGTDYTFRFDQYFDVLGRLIPHLARGVTVIVRSTVAPHFTRNVVMARISSERDWIPGVDFGAAFCPERLVQGQALQGIDQLPEIIGADDELSARQATALLRSLCEDKPCLRLSTIEAELAKLFLNTYRYTVFGLANEFALVSEEYGANFHAIRAAANSGYPRGGIPEAGPSRGPCLGKDTATLAFSSTSALIAHAAIKTNESLVLHVAQELRRALGSLLHRRITLLGCAFKADTDDTRDNLTAPLVNLLDREGAVTAVYDPLVATRDDPAVVAGSDALVLMTPHHVFRGWSREDLLALSGSRQGEPFVFDLWNIWPWADRIFGKGTEVDESPGDGSMRLADASRRPTSA
jgi:UDP-N-acetyl-D-mannosaminuronic acid dehydrogenase